MSAPRKIPIRGLPRSSIMGFWSTLADMGTSACGFLSFSNSSARSRYSMPYLPPSVSPFSNSGKSTMFFVAFQSARIRFCVIFDLIAYKISERRRPPSICGLVWQTNRAPGRSHREPTLGHCRDLELSKIAQFLRYFRCGCGFRRTLWFQ